MAPVPKSAGVLHFVQQTVYKAEKALVAAKFNGVALDKKIFDAKKDAKNPEFLAKNPMGKVPFLETDMGCICTSNSIARYIARIRADNPVYGKSFDDECKIDTWMEFCTHEIEVPLMTWVYPTMGVMQDVPKATSQAQADVKKALEQLESTLKTSPYLIGDFCSLADIVAVCALREGFQRVFDAGFRKPYPKVCAWFDGCCKMPQFKSIFGDVTLCVKAETAIPVKPEFLPPARKEPKEAAKPKQEAKPKAEAKAAPKAAPAPAAAAAASGDVTEVSNKIRALKEKLKGEGLSGKKVDAHPDVQALVANLQALKAAGPAAAPAPAAAPKPAAAAPAAAAPAAGGGDVTEVGNQIRELKTKLKGEGLSGKKVDAHPDVQALVAKLTALKSAGGGAAPAAAAPAPAAAAAPAAGGNVEAQIKAVGDDIRTLKDKLKAEGLSGGKINKHPEIEALVGKLNELKAKA